MSYSTEKIPFELPIIIALRDKRNKVLLVLLKYQVNMAKKSAEGQCAEKLLAENKTISEKAKEIIKKHIELARKNSIGSSQSSLFLSSGSHNSAPVRSQTFEEKTNALTTEVNKNYRAWLKGQSKNTIISEIEKLKELCDQAGLTIIIQVRPSTPKSHP